MACFQRDFFMISAESARKYGKTFCFQLRIDAPDPLLFRNFPPGKHVVFPDWITTSKSIIRHFLSIVPALRWIGGLFLVIGSPLRWIGWPFLLMVCLFLLIGRHLLLMVCPFLLIGRPFLPVVGFLFLMGHAFHWIGRPFHPRRRVFHGIGWVFHLMGRAFQWIAGLRQSAFPEPHAKARSSEEEKGLK